MGEIYLDHLEYDPPQDEGDKSKPITFRKDLTNMTAKIRKYNGNQLFYAISYDNNPNTVDFMCFPHHKV